MPRASLAVCALLVLLWMSPSQQQQQQQHPGLPQFMVYEDTDLRLGDEFILDARDKQTVLGTAQRSDPHRVHNRQGLQVQDEDMLLSVRLSVLRGYISVLRDANLLGPSSSVILETSRLPLNATLSQGSGAAGSLQLAGSSYEINALLDTLKYHPPPNGWGYDSLTMQVFSATTPSAGTANATALASTVLSIKILPKNDAPTITLAGVGVGMLYDDDASYPVGTVAAVEDTPLLIGSLFSIRDADMEGDVDGTIPTDGSSSGSGAGGRGGGDAWAAHLTQFNILHSHSSSRDTIYVSLEVTHGRLAVSGAIGGSVAFLSNTSAIPETPVSNFSTSNPAPSAQPSAAPLLHPPPTASLAPSTQPPTAGPSIALLVPVFPTGQPSGQPSRHPSGQPTRSPTRQPTGQPSQQPTARTYLGGSHSPRPSAAPSFGLPPAARATLSTGPPTADPNPAAAAQQALLDSQRVPDFRDVTANIAFMGAVPRRNARLDYDVRRGGARGLYIRGIYREVLAILQSVTYTPDLNYNGLDLLTIYVNDLGNFGVDGERDQTRRMVIDVASVEDPPAITMPSADMLQGQEDMRAVIGADCCMWAANDEPRAASSRFGSPIRATDHNLLPSTSTNASALSIQITDSDIVVSVNRQRTIVRNLTAIGIYPSLSSATSDPNNFNSQATPSPSAAPTTPTKAPTPGPSPAPSAVPPPPLFSLPPSAVPTASPSVQAGVTFGDPARTDLFYYTYAASGATQDGGNASTGFFTVYLAVTHGSLTLLRVPSEVSFLLGSGFQDDSIALRGSLADVNNCLRGLTFLPDLNWNSQQNDQYSSPYRDVGARGLSASIIKTVADLNVTVLDAAGLRAEDHVYLYINPTNDAPVLTMGPTTPHDSIVDEGDQLSRKRLAPAVLQCTQNTNCPLEGLAVRDIDARETAGGGVLFVLTATNGTFVVDAAKASAGVIYVIEAGEAAFGSDGTDGSDDGSGSSSGPRGLPGSRLRLTLPAADLHTLLTGVMYRPATDYSGPDVITVTADDLGNTGYGVLCAAEEARGLPCRLTDSLTIAVAVAARPDRVEIVAPPGVLVGVEDRDVAITGLALINHDQLLMPWLAAANAAGDAGRFVVSQDPNSQAKLYPSFAPSFSPTASPTTRATLTALPTYPTPSFAPSKSPASVAPTVKQPTGQPTRQPSGQPTRQPTRQPTGQPTGHPTYLKMHTLSLGPSRQPSIAPTAPLYSLVNRNITYGSIPSILRAPPGSNMPPGYSAAYSAAQRKQFRLRLSTSGGSLRVLNRPADVTTGLEAVPQVQQVYVKSLRAMGGTYTLSVTTIPATAATFDRSFYRHRYNASTDLTDDSGSGTAATSATPAPQVATTTPLTMGGGFTHATEVQAALQALPMIDSVNVTMQTNNGTECLYTVTFSMAVDVAVMVLDPSLITGQFFGPTGASKQQQYGAANSTRDFLVSYGVSLVQRGHVALAAAETDSHLVLTGPISSLNEVSRRKLEPHSLLTLFLCFHSPPRIVLPPHSSSFLPLSRRPCPLWC